MKKKALKKTTIYLAAVILLSTLELLTAPNAMAVFPSISIIPTSGVVGDTVTVSGAINTTDGSFTVRWNHALNFTGVAVGNNFTIPFNVPSTAGGTVTVELIDETLDTVVATTSFTLIAKFGMQVETLPQPRQLREGNKTSVRINVTGGIPNTKYPAKISVKDPANQTHPAFVLLTNTTLTGSGNGTAAYPTDFGSASTNLTGKYSVSTNVTTAVAEFYVGLTDKTEYRRNENVQAQAAGYKPSEVAKLNIKIGELSVVGFPQNLTASSSGLVTLSWKVPVNATPGTYHIAFTNTTTSGTIKTPNDAQNFQVLGITCLAQARNLADEAVQGALIEVYNASATAVVLSSGNTNSTGWIRFNLDKGNYTFKAFVKNMQVGTRPNEVIMADKTLPPMQLSLVNFLATVRTEAGESVPLVDVALKLTYTTRDNKTTTEATAAQTNSTGMATMRNLFTGKAYRVEARRYGLLFSNTTVSIDPSPALPLIILNLTLPNHPLNVHAVDSKGIDASGIDIRAYEWASGILKHVDRAETNLSGDISFSLPFGRYVLKAFKGDYSISEMAVDLDEPSALTFSLGTLNLDVTVLVFDYLGQPMPGAEVRLDRKIGQDFALVSTKVTDGSGSAKFDEIIGGDSRVLVYIGGELVAVKTQFLGAGSNGVVFRVAEFVAVLGYPVSSGTFILFLFVLVLIVAVLVAVRRPILQAFRKPSKP